MSDLICVKKSGKSHTHSIAGQVADIFVSWKVAAAAVAFWYLMQRPAQWLFCFCCCCWCITANTRNAGWKQKWRRFLYCLRHILALCCTLCAALAPMSYFKWSLGRPGWRARIKLSPICRCIREYVGVRVCVCLFVCCALCVL